MGTYKHLFFFNSYQIQYDLRMATKMFPRNKFAIYIYIYKNDPIYCSFSVRFVDHV